MSEESNHKRLAVFARRTKSNRGIIINLPKTYIYFDRYDLMDLIRGDTVFVRGTVYKKKRVNQETFENGEEYMNKRSEER